MKLKVKSIVSSFLFQALILVIINLCIFGYSIGFKFVLDDHDIFSKISQLNNPIDIFKSGNIFQSYYRPLFVLSLAIEHLIIAKPWFNHLVNVLLHSFVSILALYFARLLLESSPFAFISALAFSIHPTRVENVVWISGRTDILATGGMLLTVIMLYYAREKNNVILAIISGFIASIAMFTKEIALLTPIMCIAVWWALKTENRKTRKQESKKIRKQKSPKISNHYLHLLIISLIIQFIGVLIFLISRSSVQLQQQLAPLFSSYIETFFNVFRNFALYIFHILTGGGEEYLVLGWRMADSSGMNFLPLPDNYLYIVGIIITVIIFFSWIIWSLIAFKKFNKSLVIFISLLMFVLLLIPVIGIIPIQYIYSTRYLYLPILFFFIAVAGTIELILMNQKAEVREKIFVFCFLFLIFVLALGTIKTFTNVKRWKDDVTLFEWMTTKCPQVPVAHYCLGNGYRYRAEEEISKLQNPNYKQGDNETKNKAITLMFEAIKHFNKSRMLWSKYRDAYINEGASYRLIAQLNPSLADSCLKSAIKVYETGAKEIPTDYLIPMLAGDTFLSYSDVASAENAYKSAFQRDPTNSEIQMRLSRIYQMKYMRK